MPTTYGELLQAITADLRRPDLVDAAQDFSQKVIFTLQRVFFYDSQTTVMITLTQGNPFAPMPDNLIDIDMARLVYQNTYQPLEEKEYTEILLWDTEIPSTQSVPVYWSPYSGQIRLFPVPNQNYQLELTGPGKIPAPEAEDDSNFWTVDAFTLVRHATTATIRAIRLRDPAGAEIDRLAAEMEKVSLLGQTALRESNNAIDPWW